MISNLNPTFFDIESDGLLNEATKVHCIAIAQDNQPDVWLYHDDPGIEGDGSIEEGLLILREAELLVAHNGQGFDIPLLMKLYPDWDTDAEILDTLILSKLLYSDLFERDCRRKYEGFPTKLWGRHSLMAWGRRISEAKGDYSGGWEEFSQDMADYCRQDVRVLQELYAVMQRRQVSPQAVALEHAFAACIHKMNQRGVAFNEEGARDLEKVLTVREAEVEDSLRKSFDDFENRYVTPKKKLERVKKIVFNPGSRAHISRALMEQRGWEPKEYGKDGKPKLDETVLRDLDYEEIPLIIEGLLLDKRLGQLSRGRVAWLDQVEDGTIRPYVNHSGTVTFRCTHSKPNVSQVPSVRSPYGKECRSLWGPRKGMVLVGADASAVELRILAHYLVPFDGGRLAEVLNSGQDPHSHTQDVAGLESRDQAKLLTYATLYGAGAKKIASSLGLSERRAKSIRNTYLNSMGIGNLIEACKGKARSSGFLRGLDGRSIPVRKLSAALNCLIQGNASILLKQWAVILDPTLEELNAQLVLHVHDEVQIECAPLLAPKVAAACEESLLEAGEHLGLRVKTPADSKVGADWSETH